MKKRIITIASFLLVAGSISIVLANNKAKIKKAARILKADRQIEYEAEVQKMDVLFDSNGKFLREEKD